MGGVTSSAVNVLVFCRGVIGPDVSGFLADFDFFDRDDAVASIWEDTPGHDFDAGVDIAEWDGGRTCGLGGGDGEVSFAETPNAVANGDAVHHDAVKRREGSVGDNGQL